jgi:WD40 repeat protein
MQNVSDKFITSSADGTMRIWDANDYSVKARCVNQVANSPGVHPLCALFTDEIVLSGWSDGKVRGYRVDNNQMLWQIDNAHKNGVTAIALSHNNKFIVSGGMEGEIRVWEIRSRELISHLKEHTSKVTKVQIFADDIHLLSCSRDKSILCWDLKNQKRISNQTVRMGGINCFAVSPTDSNQYLSVGQDRKITYWDIRKSQSQGSIESSPNPGESEELFAIDIQQTGKLFATGGQMGIVRIYDY